MKLTKRIAVLLVLSIGVFMNLFIDNAQASSCYYCVVGRTNCFNNCNTLPPGSERDECRVLCVEYYDDCIANCPG